MDWKEQLKVVLREGDLDHLDVRFVCIKDQEKWFLKHLRAKVFQIEPSVPAEVLYPSYLFLRQKMSSSDFLHLIDDLTNRLPSEELTKLPDEKKLKTICVRAWEIKCEYIGIGFAGHAQGNTDGVLVHRSLPSWNFNGNIYPDLPEGQEPLVASISSYFSMPIDGKAWYLYENALQPPNNYLPAIDISLEDSRAFIQDVVIDPKTGTLQCWCEGKWLPKVILNLFTNTLQTEQRQAQHDVTFQLQGEPKIFSVALTHGDTWLDKRDINLYYQPLGIPKGVNIIGVNLHPGSMLSDPTSAIEEIIQSDPSDVAAIAAPHLKIVNSYYLNGLSQSQQSFFWALIGGGVGILFFIIAVLFFINRPFGDATNLASIITATGGAVVSVITGILLRIYGSASSQATGYLSSLDRIQRFFIANSACEGLGNERKDATREVLIKKLSDL